MDLTYSKPNSVLQMGLKRFKHENQILILMNYSSNQIIIFESIDLYKIPLTCQNIWGSFYDNLPIDVRTLASMSSYNFAILHSLNHNMELVSAFHPLFIFTFSSTQSVSEICILGLCTTPSPRFKMARWCETFQENRYAEKFLRRRNQADQT